MGGGDNSSSSKADKKAALKQEAETLGIPYTTLKKERKNNKKRREAEQLLQDDGTGVVQHQTELKRMRTWSKDFDHHDDVETLRAKKKPRTRLQEATAELPTTTPSTDTRSPSPPLSPDAWRREHGIQIQQQAATGDAQNIDTCPFFQFTDSPYCSAILKLFQQAGFETPTPIQSQAWPIALQGRDMICIAKTGSGKTLGFLLPVIHQHLEQSRRNQITTGASAAVAQRGGRGRGRGRTGRQPSYGSSSAASAVLPVLLVLAPTRELAVQIMEEAVKFGRSLGIRSVCCYGGSSKYPQIAALDRGVDCIIATPGRLNDLLEMKRANLSAIQYLVLDEADRMLDMGFEPQIRSIIKHVPEPHQTMLFSATWPREIQQLAHDFLKNPVQINVGDANSLVANKDIVQSIHMCQEADKFDKLTALLNELVEAGSAQESANGTNKRGGGGASFVANDGKLHPKVIVFVAKKVSCNDLANQLWDDGFAVDSLHGDRPQWERTKVMNAFKSGQLRMLIATDVAARGLDVKDVGVVVNYDMPAGVNAVEDYVHRIGRTGRAGAKGNAHTFFTQGDRKCARQLVEVLNKAEQDVPPGLQAMVPRFHGRNGGYGRGGRGRGRGYMMNGGGRSYMMGGGGGGAGRRYGGGYGSGGGRGYGGRGFGGRAGRGRGRGR